MWEAFYIVLEAFCTLHRAKRGADSVVVTADPETSEGTKSLKKRDNVVLRGFGVLALAYEHRRRLRTYRGITDIKVHHCSSQGKRKKRHEDEGGERTGRRADDDRQSQTPDRQATP